MRHWGVGVWVDVRGGKSEHEEHARAGAHVLETKSVQLPVRERLSGQLLTESGTSANEPVRSDVWLVRVRRALSCQLALTLD